MSETLTVDVLNADGKKAGTADLPAEVFDVQTNVPLIHQVVVAQQRAGRQLDADDLLAQAQDLVEHGAYRAVEDHAIEIAHDRVGAVGRAVGLRQVDGMPREPECGWAEQSRSEPTASTRHAPRRTSRTRMVK